MKIEIVTDRRPFLNGAACSSGQIVECSADEGANMIANGFAIEIQPAKISIKTASKAK